MTSYYEMFRDSENCWRWHYFGYNGQIIAISSESYWSQAECLRAINMLKGSCDDPVYVR